MFGFKSRRTRAVEGGCPLHLENAGTLSKIDFRHVRCCVGRPERSAGWSWDVSAKR